MPKRDRRGPPGPDRWLVSYADFITLLFAFFTTMYAISTVDARKLTAVVDSMNAAFAKGDVPAAPARIGTGHTPGPSRPRAAARAVHPGLEAGGAVPVAELRTRLTERLTRHIDEGLVTLEVDPRGLVVSIREAGSFATGSADLSLGARALLGEVAQSLREVQNFVRIEGHTDDVPIHTARFASNWELSTARATTVVAAFLAEGLAAARLSAAGYAEFHPREPNDSDANRARNRRVDVVVLNPVTVAREEPGGVASAPAAWPPAGRAAPAGEPPGARAWR
jgi:chemotaxis protein MotB